jgi:hypothetical protein
MKKFLILLLVTAYGLLVTLPAAASYISLRTTVSSKVIDHALEVSVSAVNKGDESAHNVQAEIKVGGKKILANKIQELGINGAYRVRAVFDLDYKTPGEYPLVVTMHYADANMYPFSALNCQTFAYKAEALPASIFGSISSASFWKKGRAKLTLKNMGASEIETSTCLVVPRELTAAEESFKVRVPAKSSGQISFEIENFSALGGSTYQVFAVSEYEKNGVHHTNVAPGMIKIVERKEIFGISYTILVSLLIILVLVFTAAQFRRRKKIGT